MFEKEAEEYRKDLKSNFFLSEPQLDLAYQGFKDGYNKANEWQFVSEKGLPKESGRYLVYVGGGENGVYPLDFDTEYNDFGYWCSIINSANLGVTDTVFETITERNEDKVIAWKEIILPSEPMRSLDKEELEELHEVQRYIRAVPSKGFECDLEKGEFTFSGIFYYDSLCIKWE